jgi:hypothetical protein
VTRFQLPRRQPAPPTEAERVQAAADAEHDAAVERLIAAVAGERQDGPWDD